MLNIELKKLLNNFNEWCMIVQKEVMGRDVEVGTLWVSIKDIIINKSLGVILSGIGHIIREFLSHQ